jgi:hypothetical protein
MANIPKPAEDCNRNPTASSKNAAFTASTLRDVSNEGGDPSSADDGDKWILFNKELAELMGGRDGIICAVLTYGLYTWIMTPAKSFGYIPTIDGKKACYRSTRQLMDEYSIDGKPLWDDTTIFNAVKRMNGKRQCGLVVDTSKKQLHFAMSDKLLKMHKSTKGFLRFKLSDAIKYGVLEAILIANLDRQIRDFKRPVTDGEGLKYGELSATKLTKKDHRNRDYKEGRILPVSKDAVDDALAELRNGHVLVQHLKQKSFYRRVMQGEMVPKCTENASKQGGAKISSAAAKISSRGAKISSHEAVMSHKCHEMRLLHCNPQSLDSNIDKNPDIKWVTPHSESSLRSDSQCGVGDLLSSSYGQKQIIHQFIEHEPMHSDIKGAASDVTVNTIIHRQITNELHEEINDQLPVNYATYEEIMDELLGNDELVHEQAVHELITDEEYECHFITHKEISDSLMTPDIDGVARHVGCNMGLPGRMLLEAIKNAPLNSLYAYHPLTPSSPYAVYQVLDYDNVKFIGYEFDYDFIPLDPNTTKPYSRKTEIDYSIEDIKFILRSMPMAYTADDVEKLQQLFIDHPHLTFEHVRLLLRWCEPKVEPMYLGDWSAPEKGHDPLFFARRTNSLGKFLKHLPQIINEWYRNEIIAGVTGEYPLYIVIGSWTRFGRLGYTSRS